MRNWRPNNHKPFWGLETNKRQSLVDLFDGQLTRSRRVRQQFVGHRRQHRVHDPRVLAKPAHVDCNHWLLSVSGSELLQQVVVVVLLCHTHKLDHINVQTRGELVLALPFGRVPLESASKVVVRTNDLGVPSFGAQGVQQTVRQRQLQVQIADSQLECQLAQLLHLGKVVVRELSALGLGSQGEDNWNTSMVS
ncbi:hypothetical protein OGAPHI_006802 [Ogataea philodendri]|uniref:Uncharacterized protein n=1 Tax=Ogataea philodendri TaxID=1378263 RepID=A0A9P8NX54_9ASCO|nr:uncharacterized protein OGAPHI_006802 [Ogataea philodendri]KAH3661395.1 hypothetical protein OGAPHI_006802 [Ogataea philodendri]